MNYFDKIEKEYLKLEGIKLNIPVEDKSVDEFVYNFLTEYNRNQNTVSMSGVVKTSRMKSRSLRDIFLLSKHYFPKTTLSQVAEILSKTLGNNVICYHCKDVGSIVFKSVFGDYLKSYTNHRLYKNGYMQKDYNYESYFDLPEIDFQFLKLINVED